MNTLYKDFTFDTVLVGGLGLGLIPEYLKTQENCSVVDVVEINNELISWVNSEGFLDNTINIIEGDIYSYSTSNKYDLIIIDLWWDENEISEQNKTDLLANWSDNLNVGGKIILPVAELSLN
jgi:spermidine synthase